MNKSSSLNASQFRIAVSPQPSISQKFRVRAPRHRVSNSLTPLSTRVYSDNQDSREEQTHTERTQFAKLHQLSSRSTRRTASNTSRDLESKGLFPSIKKNTSLVHDTVNNISEHKAPTHPSNPMFFSTEVDTNFQSTPARKPELKLRMTSEPAEMTAFRQEVNKKLQFFDTFKNMDSILQRNLLEDSPANLFLKECHSSNLLPCSFKLYNNSGSVRNLRAGHYRMGDRYLKALSLGLSKNKNIEKLELKDNRLSDQTAATLFGHIGTTIQKIDLSYNSIGAQTIASLGGLLNSPRYK